MPTTRSALLLALLTLASCGSSDEAAAPTAAPDVQSPSAQPATPPATQPATLPAADAGAKVLETMDSGGYTYALLEMGGQKDWFAVTLCPLKVGDRVKLTSQPMKMTNFASPSLNRTFETIYFASGFQKIGAAAPELSEEQAEMVKQAHANLGEKEPAAEVDADTVPKAEGGLTVAEIWAQGKANVGKEILLRGKVVKFNAGILGHNWLHVRDGSGAEGTNDITITTDATVNVGDTVLIKGKLGADRDFGAGYFYALILEDAAVTVE